MKMTDINNDREKSQLMKELHELGLRHGVWMVVVAVPMDIQKPDAEIQSFLIDHKDNTTAAEVAHRFEAAGVYLIKAADAVGDYAATAEQDTPQA